MDLRAIINSDGGGASKSSSKPPPPPKVSTPVRSPPGHHLDHRSQPGSTIDTSYAPGSYPARPAPPSLQPVSSDFRSPTSTSYHSANSAQSPHSYTPSSAISGGGHQYPFPQHTPAHSPGQSQYPVSYSYRDGYPPGQQGGSMTQSPHGQPSRYPSQPPHTPIAASGGYSYSQHQYPQSQSVHSSPTPTSAHGPSPHGYHDSPQSASSQSHLHAISHLNHPSQPGTPLGPPVSGTQGQASETRNGREPLSLYNHHRTQSAGVSISPLQAQVISPTTVSAMSGAMSRPSHQTNGHQQSHINGERLLEVSGRYSPSHDRERSMSVSPKTKLPSHMRSLTVPHNLIQQREISAATEQRRVSEEVSRHPLPASPHLRTERVSQSDDRLHPTGGDARPTTLHPPANAPPQEPDQRSRPSTSPVSSTKPPPSTSDHSRPASRDRPQHFPGSRAPREDQTPTPRTSIDLCGKADAPVSSSASPAPLTTREDVAMKGGDSSSGSTPAPTSIPSMPRPGRKRAREEPPIFARSVKNKNQHASGRKPTGPVGGFGASGANLIKVEPRKAIATLSTETVGANGTANGSPTVAQRGGTPAPVTTAGGVASVEAPLGPWEPTFNNIIPSDEITRTIMDFLFVQVVSRKDVSAGPAGGLPGTAAQVEIEAKLGQLVDKNTNDRIRIPSLTECVFNKEDPSYRTTFKSSMTESQHRALNQYLNRAVTLSRGAASQKNTDGTPQARIPVEYVHTRERDRFYDLPTADFNGLPPSVRPYIHGRRNLKVRVTTDQKTGRVLAKIVKVRVADMDVFSPRTAFDWRLSINLEMSYDGQVDGLTEVLEEGKKPDRNKDRVSYRHLAYQIDLTQVTKHADGQSKVEKEHELEIELSADMVRKQGRLMQTGQPQQYEDLVKGFVDNVRLLARAIPQQ